MIIMKKIKSYFNQDMLKLFALIAMSVNHIAILSSNPVFKAVEGMGRVAFPVFSYLIMLHLNTCHCFKKYMWRLGLFGVISQIILGLFPFNTYNIFWTFLIAVFSVYIITKINKNVNQFLLKYVEIFIVISFGLLVSVFVDYSIFGFCYLLSLYGYFNFKNTLFTVLTLIFAALLNPLNATYAFISLMTTIFMMLMQNTPRTHKRSLLHRWFFYVYYPAHLVFLYSLKMLNILF